MSDQLPEAVERVLQQFEAMAPAADWRLVSGHYIRTGCPAGGSLCPLAWMAGQEFQNTDRAVAALGLSEYEGASIWKSADGEFVYGASEAIRARLLAAAGLA